VLLQPLPYKAMVLHQVGPVVEIVLQPTTLPILFHQMEQTTLPNWYVVHPVNTPLISKQLVA
jgi:hypothetical protein